MIIQRSETQSIQFFQKPTAAIQKSYPAIVEGQEFVTYFQPDDEINWHVLGPALTFLPTTLLMKTHGGEDVQVSVASGSPLRIDQTPNFEANFELGDALFCTGFGNPGQLTIVFENPIFAASTLIQSDTSHVPEYSVTLEAFDRLDNSVAKVKSLGVNQKVGGGTIPLTAVDAKGRIKKLTIAAKEQGINIPFAINSIILKTHLGL